MKHEPVVTVWRNRIPYPTLSAAKPLLPHGDPAMSMFDYRASQAIAREDFPFYALIMAAMRKADTRNAALLRTAFPEVWAELDARYNAPAGILPTDHGNEDEA